MERKQPFKKQLPIDFTKELSISDGKMPPNAVDIEKLVIGTLLIDGQAIDKVRKRFLDNSEIFYDPKHVVIFEVICFLNDKGQPVDIMMVIQELKRKEKLSLAGGDHYIIELTMGVSSSANIDYHLMIVLEKFLARQMINYCAHTIDLLYRESTDAISEIDSHIANINLIEETIARQKEGRTTLELHKELIQMQREKVIPGVKSKHSAIERRLNGWRNGNLIIIGARPAMGKTTFVLDDVFNSAKRGVPVGFFSLEMSAQELHQKMVSNDTDINGNALRDRTLTDIDMQKLFQTSTFDKLPFYIEDGVFDLNQILAKSRLMVKEKKVKIIAIDYLQLIEISNSKGMSREQVISTVSRKLKQLAKELEIPVIALSQLSRSLEQRPNKRPLLSDLRESGAIEQDADIVAFLYRPEYYKIETWDRDWDGEVNLPTKNEVEIIFAKFRGGGVFEERLKFRGDLSKFYDLNSDFGTYVNPVPFGNPSDAFGTTSKEITDFRNTPF